jgi:hypothetical protein
MKPIYNTGDKVYLTQEEDYNDYEIVEISPDDDSVTDSSKYKYKIKPVKGDKTLVRSETEIFPITG